ncbi:3195_t:CDS:2, partial [Funneliformis geosporum]
PQKGKMFHLASNKETVLAELWDWAKKITSLPIENQKSASLIYHLRKDVQGIVCALKTDFQELQIKEYHGKSDPEEKAHDFSNFEQAFCLFNSFIEINARTNQMLFRIRYIKDYICHIEQRSSNIPITEKGLFQWLLNTKRECLSRELQNRGIFPDHLFDWRIVNFFRKAVVKVNSITVKVEEISAITNATIVNRKTAEFWKTS